MAQGLVGEKIAKMAQPSQPAHFEAAERWARAKQTLVDAENQYAQAESFLANARTEESQAYLELEYAAGRAKPQSAPAGGYAQSAPAAQR